MSDEVLRKKIGAWLETQGYPLEMLVAQMFQSSGFNVTQSNLYIDPETTQYREIDVQVRAIHKFEQELQFEIGYQIECKVSRDKPWLLFRSSQKVKHFILHSAFHSEISRKFFLSKPGLRDVPSLSSARFLNPDWVGYGVTQAFTSGQDVPYQAIMSSIKASFSVIQEMDTTNTAFDSYFLFGIMFPVIIIDGLLYECFLNKEREILIQEIEHGAVRIRSTKYNRWPPIIHIFTKKSINILIEASKEVQKTLVEYIESKEQEIYQVVRKAEQGDLEALS